MNLAQRIGRRLSKHGKLLKAVSRKLRKLPEPKFPNPLDTYVERLRNTCANPTVIRPHYDDTTEYLSTDETYALMHAELQRIETNNQEN